MTFREVPDQDVPDYREVPYRHVQRARWSWLISLAGVVGVEWAIVAGPQRARSWRSLRSSC